MINLDKFEFACVPKLIFEWGGAQRLAQIIETFGSPRQVMIISDQGLVQAGIVSDVMLNLERAEYSVSLYSAVQPDPLEQQVIDAAEMATNVGAEIIIGLGGGSSLDVAKLVAIMAQSQQPLSQMYGINKVKGQRLPLIQIPTTAGTGSEVTNIAILTTSDDNKMGIVDAKLFCDVVVLDAQLTLKLPAIHTAASGIDAMVHAIEAYTSKHKKNLFSDLLAKEALVLLSQNLVAACNDGNNRAAREANLLGATLAGIAFANSPVAAVHALAYPLGAQHHISHGLSNSLMLLPVLHFNLPSAQTLYAELAMYVGASVKHNVQQDSDAFINKMAQIIAECQVPQRLREVGILHSDLSSLAQAAMAQTRLLVNNPRELTEQNALELYQQAW